MVLHRSIFMGIWVLVFVLIIDVGFDQDSTLSAMNAHSLISFNKGATNNKAINSLTLLLN
ncbi:hypothetical protein BLOT_007470 [Blomia tropicalis]|nr:hypothetical protein BLOT_007470 [Blomia tropicalis]